MYESIETIRYRIDYLKRLGVEDNLNQTRCRIHFIKAKNGDCFLLVFPNKKCVLIDCGYKETYETEIKPLLTKLSGEEYRVGLMVVTHPDQDHIGGAIAFLEENGDSRNPKIIPVDNIWYNGIFNTCIQFPEIQKHIVEKLDRDVSERIQKLKFQFQKLISSGNGEISAELAEDFENLCVLYHYNLNCGKNSLLAGEELIFDSFKIRAISPSIKELQVYASWINRSIVSMLGEHYQITNEEFVSFLEKMVLAVTSDEIGAQRIEEISVNEIDLSEWMGLSNFSPMNEANRVSIVLEIIFEDKHLLFMGDSESSDWIGLARDHYDLVKLSHHGTSKPNLELLEKVDFDKVLIATNGLKYNHPENDCLARLIIKPVKELYFNYDISQKEDLINLAPQYSVSIHFGQEIIDV